MKHKCEQYLIHLQRNGLKPKVVKLSVRYKIVSFVGANPINWPINMIKKTGIYSKTDNSEMPFCNFFPTYKNLL